MPSSSSLNSPTATRKCSHCLPSSTPPRAAWCAERSFGQCMSDPLVIGLVAGESSGDTLGAALLEALRARVGALRAFGVAGPKMQAAGCEVWADSHELAVMGLIEPLAHLPRLIALRRRLVRQFTAARPQVFVGIDAPAFNIGLEAKLRAAHIP